MRGPGGRPRSWLGFQLLTMLGAALLGAACGSQAVCAEVPVVAVDVGHSLQRPGATSARGRSEFAFNRDLALIIARKLRERGFRTLIIGERGDADDLKARTVAGADAGADLFLSIHHDSVQPQYLDTWVVDGRALRHTNAFSGYSLFVSRKNSWHESSLTCARAIGETLRRDGHSPSLHHAEPIPGENRPLADAANGVYFFDDLIVLKTARSPAVLVEAGIIVNANDELTLRDPAAQGHFAAAVADGIQRCLGAPASAGQNRQR